MALNERFAWALTILEIQPKDKVLEIGCGLDSLLSKSLSRQQNQQRIN